MNKIATYFKESYKELLEKVTWPTWVQLQQATMIVLVATLLFTALIAVMDLGASKLLQIVYNMMK